MRELFKRRKQPQATDHFAVMLEQERIYTHFAAAVGILIAAAREAGGARPPGALHLFAAGEASAIAHVEYMDRMGGTLGYVVARLCREDSDTVKAATYRADVIVGTFEDFVADLGRETDLGISRYAAMVEGGGPEPSNPVLLPAYRRVASE